ncbi:hypothetical protein E2C01_061937 [Portunus trituberculatus]|uniref:Uncharacterized protein n=1 Tax=Portunus trituberculatus TaxID=210409 RepID=A0A5B7HGP2_PORTR|nr:hypothetical protein [Portunus trituberculatus]
MDATTTTTTTTSFPGNQDGERGCPFLLAAAPYSPIFNLRSPESECLRAVNMMSAGGWSSWRAGTAPSRPLAAPLPRLPHAATCTPPRISPHSWHTSRRPDTHPRPVTVLTRPGHRAAGRQGWLGQVISPHGVLCHVKEGRELPVNVYRSGERAGGERAALTAEGCDGLRMSLRNLNIFQSVRYSVKAEISDHSLHSLWRAANDSLWFPPWPRDSRGAVVHSSEINRD